MLNVVAAIVIKNNKILLARRKINLSHGGYWEFPGGKIKQGEEFEEAIRREMYEEFGVIFHPEKYLGFVEALVENKVIRLHGILGRLKNDFQFMIDHDSVKWIDPDDIFSLKLSKADILLVENYLNEIKTNIPEKKE